MLVENLLLRSSLLHFVCKRHKTNQKSSPLDDPPLWIITFPLIPPPEWSIFTLPISTLTSVCLTDSSLSTWPIFLLFFIFGFSAIKISTLHSDRLIVHLFCHIYISKQDIDSVDRFFILIWTETLLLEVEIAALMLALARTYFNFSILNCLAAYRGESRHNKANIYKYYQYHCIAIIIKAQCIK